MKKTLVLLMVLTPFLLKAQHAYTIQGKLGMPVDGKVYLHWFNLDTGKHLDSADAIYGQFSFNGSVQHTETGQLIFRSGYGDKSVVFYLEPGNIMIDYPADAEYARLSGTPLNNDLQQYNKMLYSFLDSINAGRQGKQLYTWYSKEIMGGKIGVIGRFIEKHPASQVGLDQLEQYAIGNKTPDILDPLYEKLTPGLRKSPIGVEVASRIKGMRSSDVGDEAPLFTLPDTSGHKVSLADYRGKYVLIDFWATWCSPCMAEMPNVVKAYNQYKDKGFEIIGVSLDRPDSKELWKQVIRRDHLDWKQVSDLNWWNSKAALVYNVNSVPANFLIDPKGKIIAKNLRGEVLQNRLTELFKLM
jgi:peroxiredoxin